MPGSYTSSVVVRRATSRMHGSKLARVLVNREKKNLASVKHVTFKATCDRQCVVYQAPKLKRLLEFILRKMCFGLLLSADMTTRLPRSFGSHSLLSHSPHYISPLDTATADRLHGWHGTRPGGMAPDKRCRPACTAGQCWSCVHAAQRAAPHQPAAMHRAEPPAV